jgi:hypothetical protein
LLDVEVSSDLTDPFRKCDEVVGRMGIKVD